ncbi:MAG: hypothetical protein AUJ49_10765 [Desulfovibrionaceae bacterium CG1_02_65_16]|nr:MAG: hypothetical protein AUJ49_10765 [Desulfovibrionaceae bacterium CG1_02_65_16]
MWLYRTLCLLLAAALLCGGCRSQGGQTAGEHAAPGVTDTSITLGSSLALSGHAGYLGTQTLRGALCYLRQVNEDGGVNGRRIDLTVYDDSYDPPRCLANTQRLIIKDQVFALFCYVGTPTTVKILPMVEEAGIPLLGMFTGANALREPFSRLLVNIRASYYQETAAAVRHLVADLGLRRIAVFYQYDAYGFDGLTGTELALKTYGLEPVARGSYVRGTLGVEEGFGKIRGSGAEAVVMIGTYGACARFIQLARESRFSPLFYTVSFVGAEELARRIGPRPGEVIIMSQVVPPVEAAERAETAAEASAPATVAAMAGGARRYARLLAKYYPDDKPNSVGLEGYYNAQVLVEALRRAGRGLTRAGFIEALESIHGLELEPGLTASFGPANHQGLERVFFTRLRDGRFVLVDSWSGLARELAAARPGGRP